MAAEGLKTEPRPSDVPAVPSTERVSISREIPSEWLDRLLVTHCAVRADAPLEDAVTAHLSVARELLAGAPGSVDEIAMGVCIPRSAFSLSEALDEARATSQGQLVVRLSGARASHASEPDAARLFPEIAYERVIAVIPEEGATLHVAVEDEARLADGSAAAFLVERVAQLLASTVDNHRAVERGLRDLRAQVIQSEKLASLGQIAAGIVHELNNPLTAIVAYSDFLRHKLAVKGDPADVDRLVRINEAAERILRFSRDLIAYSRPADEVPAPVAIHDVIDRALGFCEHELDKTGVMVEKSFGDVSLVRGVAGQLTQVFVNLFTNAAHAMRDEGGLLSISTVMAPSAVEITISDDGHGIDADHRDRVFEPFFTTKTDGSGTGLGLSIVRSIVQSHGGNIRVGGNSPRGTVFHVELPLAAAPQDGDQ